MSSDKITIQVTINRSDLTDIFGNESDFSCRGASGEAEPINARVKVVQYPTKRDPEGESYVFCPRLISLAGELRCFEGKIPEDFNQYDKNNLEKSGECPFYRPRQD